MHSLTPAQHQALTDVRMRALAAQSEARRRLAAVLDGYDVSFSDIMTGISHHSTVTLNFHPDRVGVDGRTVAEALRDSGRYESQFVTGVSNGANTGFIGGSRDLWEARCFGEAYQTLATDLTERPKYGALNLMAHADGAAPRFGSCFIVLRPEVLERCTFCFGDSHNEPTDIGTLDAFECLLAALFESAARKGNVLGREGISVAGLLACLSGERVRDFARVGRALDDYIEAQVHGPVDFTTDVQAIVMDPSFVGTQDGDALAEAAERYGLTLDVHPGFALPVERVTEDFRGPAMLPLARRIRDRYGSPTSAIDAALIGKAFRASLVAPETWADWGSPEEIFRHIKQLWHCTVRFGEPAECPVPRISGQAERWTG